MKTYRRRRRVIHMGSRKGSYIMEAAIVLPVIVVTVITVVLIIMFFYSQMTERSKMHIAMRREAGAATGKTIYDDGSYQDVKSDAELYVKNTFTGSSVYGKKYLIMSHRGVLEKKGTFVAEGICSGIDAAQYVRYCSFIKGLGNE